MNFRIAGLDPAPFAHLHALSDDELGTRGIVRVRIEAKKQQGPIFVRETRARADVANIVPPALARRTLSLRGFDTEHMMIEADLVEGADAATLIERFFANENVVYIHAHYARRGCFAATITRA